MDAGLYTFYTFDWFCAGSVVSGVDRLSYSQEYPGNTRWSFFAEPDHSEVIPKGDPRQERGVRRPTFYEYHYLWGVQISGARLTFGICFLKCRPKSPAFKVSQWVTKSRKVFENRFYYLSRS